jgi:transposase
VDPASAELQRLRDEASTLRTERDHAVRQLHDRELRIAALTETAERLAHENELLKRALFGKKSEREVLSDQQLSLLFGGEPDPPAEPAPEPEPEKKTRRGKGGRRKVKDDTTVPKRRVESPVPSQACTACGGQLKHIGDAVSYRYEWVPGRFEKLEVVRPKCACPSCPSEGVVVADEPLPFALPKALCGNELLARVLADKFVDHLPLNRQARRMKREGLELAVSTLCGWVRQGAQALKPIAERIHREVVAGDWLRADATGMPVLDGKRVKGRTHRGQLWCYGNTHQVVFRYTPDKEGQTVQGLLSDFSGTLLVDGASDFNLVVRSENLTRAGCWAHARRYFFDARKTNPAAAARALATIRRLFMVERMARDEPADSRERIREQHTRPLLEEFKTWLQEQSTRQPPRSPMGKAVGYTLRQWDRLVVFLENGQLPAHNNDTERDLRQPVVGRKAWLFAGSEGGAHSAAILFTLVGSCLLQGISPQSYLREVLDRLDTDPASKLTPVAIRIQRELRA